MFLPEYFPSASQDFCSSGKYGLLILHTHPHTRKVTMAKQQNPINNLWIKNSSALYGNQEKQSSESEKRVAVQQSL